MHGRGMVIVGAGACGTRAAFALREEGYGGAITLIGAEPYLPYERPPLSKEGMVAEHAGPKPIADEASFAAADITLMLDTRATAIDRRARSVTLSGERELPYDRLLITTGASPRRLPKTDSLRHCFYLRTQDDARRIATRLMPQTIVAIIGGGFIGLELAAAATHRGCRVTLIEAQPRLLSRAVPVEIARAVEHAHRDKGVDLRIGKGISAITETVGGLAIELVGGESLVADLCIVGIGAVPSIELAEKAGLSVENGIRVDDRLFTNDASILAAGDCCSFPLGMYGGRRVRLEAWRNTQEHGVLAAKNMLGRHEAHRAVPWFWSDQYGRTLQIAGLCDEGVTTVYRDAGEGAFILFHLDADGRLVAASGIGLGNTIARDIRLSEMLIAQRAVPDPAMLADPKNRLKSLLSA
jgi:3-phenylpropionate/trans-cinnamate dioxygenase ferredoxin reductase subunit